MSREREQREPLLLRFLVRKQYLVSRLMKQQEISVFHRIRGLLPRTRFALLLPSLESFFHMLPVLTLNLIPEFFQDMYDGYKID